MKPNSMMMFLVIFAIGASALAVFVSIWTISANYKRLSDQQRDPQLRQAGRERFSASTDPAMRSSGGSMANRRQNIENVLRRLESAEG